MERWLTTNNCNGAIALSDIPQLSYGEFYEELCGLLGDPDYHVAHYFGMPCAEGLRLYCLLLRDSTHEILVASHTYDYYCEEPLESLAARHEALHPFEREVTELYGVKFRNAPWDKPLRCPANRANRAVSIDDYPFYHMEGDSLHEVNVGPIHAGIIEPGAFRFICNGEKVLHLEISLGYQHRGVEALMTESRNLLRSMTLAESVAGDSAIAHGWAHAAALEKLAGVSTSPHVELQRTVALELERVAMHIADTGALCMDIGYQLGQVACEALRTIVINTTQLWCGNRFGKGLVRPAGSYFPLTDNIKTAITTNMAEVCRRYNEVKQNIKVTPSVLARFEQCGEVGAAQMARIGGVGMAARASGLQRDIRRSHPWSLYAGDIRYTPTTREQGDVMARLMQRSHEVELSIEYINSILSSLTDPQSEIAPCYDMTLSGDSMAVALVEGWRGEICHVAVTDSEGQLAAYKIKDPSLHNWLALALAVRGEGISDFPVCNKSFNLSYCGHDL